MAHDGLLGWLVLPSWDHRSVSALALLLPRPIDLRVHDTHVPREGIVARERLFLSAEVAADLLLPCVVDRVLVSG